MKLTRFCSRAEINKILAGETIENHTDHYNGGKGGSTSKGFCFTEDSPIEAWKYLKGIVCPEVCAVYDIPSVWLTKSKGKYAGDKTVNSDGSWNVATVIKMEWCTTVLNPNDIKIIAVIPLEYIAPDYELDACRAMWDLQHAVWKWKDELDH